jgi:hypothetical protein
MEMGTPNILMRNGWRRDTLKSGDMVTVDGFLAKDGSPTGNANSVVLVATGKRLFAGSSFGRTRNFRLKAEATNVAENHSVEAVASAKADGLSYW